MSASAPFAEAPAILMYHRIAPRSDWDPWDLVVSPDHFARHLAFVSSCRTVLPIDELMTRVFDGSCPSDAIGITFDDGYADNLLIAKPLLESTRTPATVFLATQFLGRASFWWDELAAIFAAVPGHRLPANDRLRAFDFHGEIDLESAWRRLRDVEQDDRALLLQALSAEAPHELRRNPMQRPMTADEVRALANGLVEIAAHTASHAFLPAHDSDFVAREIAESLVYCRELNGGAISSFAYPYGAIDLRTRDVVAASGVRWAFTTMPGSPRRTTDRFAIPRVPVPDVDEVGLQRILEGITGQP